MRFLTPLLNKNILFAQLLIIILFIKIIKTKQQQLGQQQKQVQIKQQKQQKIVQRQQFKQQTRQKQQTYQKHFKQQQQSYQQQNLIKQKQFKKQQQKFKEQQKEKHREEFKQQEFKQQQSYQQQNQQKFKKQQLNKQHRQKREQKKQQQIDFESPCQFPSSNLFNFARYCQFDYHQLSYLCDPTGILSRTESELIDRQIQRQYSLINQHNLTGCICLNNNEHCQIKYNQKNSLKISLIMIPYTTLYSVNQCIERRKLAEKILQSASSNSKEQINYYHVESEQMINTYPLAALAYAQEIIQRWTTAKIQCDMDLLLLYINVLLPNQLIQPFTIRIFRRRLKHLISYPKIFAVEKDSNPFKTVLFELSNAIKLAQQHEHNNYYEDYSNEINVNKSLNTRIPKWAFFLVFGLIGIVLITFIIGNFVNRRLAGAKQLKKQTMSIASRSTNNEKSLSNVNKEFKRIGYIGAVGGNNSGTAQINTTSSNYIMGGGGSTATKSSMMFRHFSGGSRRGPKHQSDQSHKI